MLRTQFAILLTVALSTPAQTESKAYSEAVRLKDPVNKLVALEKFVADYPNGNNFLRTAYADDPPF